MMRLAPDGSYRCSTCGAGLCQRNTGDLALGPILWPSAHSGRWQDSPDGIIRWQRQRRPPRDIAGGPVKPYYGLRGRRQQCRQCGALHEVPSGI